MKLTVGQASKMYGISTDTLRYYDKIGILKPEVNDENGYRYYDLKQLEKLGLILSIKYLGISLNDIKELIESEDINEYKKIMELQDEIIDRKIYELKQLKKATSQGKKIINSILEFENEYDFSKLKKTTMSKKFYGFSVKDLMESRSFAVYKELVLEYEEEFEEDDFIYIYDIKSIDEIIENEEHIFVALNDVNKDFIEAYLKESKVSHKSKEIDGDIISVDFYGGEKELEEYLLSMIKYFSKSSGDLCINYNFHIPRKNKDGLYFTNIILEI